MAKLSVIIPVYNVEKYLNICLDSVTNQTCKDIEIICVNDGSTDNSLRILEEYAKKDNQIKIINKENGGLSSARNAGIEAATSEYITFLDSYDYIENNTYEIALRNISGADIVCFGTEVFGDAHYELRISDENYYKIKNTGLLKLTDKIIMNTDVSVWNKIFKKSIIDEYNIFFPTGFLFEDAEFFFKYIKCCNNAYYINKKLHHYRRTENSIMSETFKGSEKALEHLYIVKHIFNFYKDNNFLKNNEVLFVKIFIYCFNFAYWNSKLEQRPKILHIASEYAKEFSDSLKIKTNFMKNLAQKRYREIFVPDLKFCQKIYKKVKVFDILDRCNKEYIWLFGFKIKKYRKDIEIIRRLNSIEEEILKLKNKD